MLAAFASLWADIEQLSIVNRALDGERVTLAELQSSDDLVSTTAILYTVVWVLAGITFLLWYSRAYRNIQALGVTRPRWGRKWAIAYWFIPIVNLFRPKQVMNDIWRGSNPQLPAHAEQVEHEPVSPLLHWWWAAWLLSGWIANFAIRQAFESGTPSADDVRNQATAYVITDISDLVVGVLAILVIRRITARQEERIQAFGSRALPGQQIPPPPPSTPPPPVDPVADTARS